MSKRHKEWARKARTKLIADLGDRCAVCGVASFAADLEFDCILRQGDSHHRMDTSARMSFYRRQHRMGNVQTLCPDCHKEKNHLELDLETLPLRMARFGLTVQVSLLEVTGQTDCPF